MTRRPIGELRSQRWFASDDMRGFAHRQRTQQMGLRREEFLGKPVVAIVNTWSDLSPCHSHLRDRAEAVKRGVWQAGGYPVELPALSVGEVMVKPTTMLYRNFLAMEVEELLRSHPIDGAVLLGGCDKSTPGLLMGAISMDIPVIYCPAGPMSNGQWRGQKTGAGTHTKKYWDELRAGNITQADWVDLESRMTRSIGTCNTMGTASTMTSIVDAMGLTLPGASSIPAADSGHPRMASACGERIVEMIWEDWKPSRFLDAKQLPQRSGHLHGARGLHQRRRAPHRHGAPGRCRPHPRRYVRHGRQGAGLRQSLPVRRVPDGGLLLRGRTCRHCSGSWSGISIRMP